MRRTISEPTSAGHLRTATRGIPAIIALVGASLLLFTSCKKDFATVLTGGDYKYWYHGDSDWKSFYYFDDGGNFAIFKYNKQNGFYRWIEPCIGSKDTWKLESKDTIAMGWNYESIDSFSPDSIVLSGDAYYPAPDSIIPPEYRRRLTVVRRKTTNVYSPTHITVEYDTYVK